MTRVRLPPDPENSCITTIVDSQGGDAALMSAVTAISLSGGSSSGSLSTLQKSLSTSTSSNIGGIENVDSIILIYDLDRVETFFRLENHWLPLIERCYNGEVSTTVFFVL
jgi:Ras family protein T1